MGILLPICVLMRADQPYIATYTQACYPEADKEKTACRPASHAARYEKKAELYMLHTTWYLASIA